MSIPGPSVDRGSTGGAASRLASARRRSLRRPLLCLALSLLVHLGAALAVVLSMADLWAPAMPITWLDLDNRLGAPRPGQPKETAVPAAKPPAREPKAPPKRTTMAGSEPRDHAPVSRRPRSDAGPGRGGPDGGQPGSGTGASKIALADLAPGDAALILLLRMDRIRHSPYEASVRRLLEVFYDHKTILWGSGLDPVNDFDALLIATPNPYRVTETFLAARSSRPVGELQHGLERAASFGAKRLRWLPAGAGTLRGEIPSPPKLAHDPRAIWLGSDVVLLADPKLAAGLTASGPATDAGAPAPSWLARLGLMGDRGGTAGSAGFGLQLQAVNLSRLVVLPPEIPAPQSAQLGIEARDPARAEAVITFASEAAARSFLVLAKKRIEAIRQSDSGMARVLRWLGVADLLASIRFQRKQAAVNASVQLDQKDVKALLEMARGAVPQVQVPGMPERRPVDAGPPRPDLSRSQQSAPDAGSASRDRGSVH